jgi:hypothetical protein
VKKIIKKCLTVFALTSFSVSMAFGGAVFSDEVSIIIANEGIGFATGGVSAARNSADSTQSIGCRVDEYLGRAYSGFCSAVDADGVRLTCLIDTDEGQAPSVNAINASSWIQFYASSEGLCLLRVSNSSAHL